MNSKEEVVGYHGKALNLRRRGPLSLLLLRGLLLCSGLSGHAVPPPSGVAPFIIPAGGLAIDGNLLANNPLAGVGDWVSLTNSGSGGGVLNQAGVPLNPATTFHIVDPFNTSTDLVFTGGNKWTDDPNLWTWTASKPSNKTDINNALVHIGSDTNGHVWVAIAGDRLSTSGDSYIDFEFLQNTLVRNTNGGFSSSGPNGGRTTNDLVLSLAFTGGGTTADFFAWRWQATNGSFAYVDVTASLPVGQVFAAENMTNVLVPYTAFGLTNYAPNAFAEAAVDMTALLGNFDQCISVGFKTILVKTKTSQSSTATIGDFVDPIQYTFKIGPSADPGPNQTRCTEGDSTAFPLMGSATAGLQPIASTTWSVVAGTATIDSLTSLSTTAHVTSVSATVRLTVVESNGCTETNDAVLTVAPLPACSITGPALVCPQSTNQFRGPSGTNFYSWTISGNGSISGPANAQTVNVTSGGICGTNFTLSLVVISNGCSSTCSTDVLVNDTTPPTLVCPGDKVLECPTSPTTNITGTAIAQDGCGRVFVSYSDSVSNTCGGAMIIARTWTATDTCGNSTNCTQTITIQDTTPPTITCPSNIVLECPAIPTTNITGVATAHDGCGSVLLVFSDVVSNTCGGSSVIARTWTATDQCGNSAYCVQTITIRDTTRPTITMPTNIVVECGSSTDPGATGTATATDTCSGVTVGYSDVVSNTCGATKIITRTWKATDDCGNTTNRAQIITVKDTTPPTIACPADATLECPATPTTNITGVATAQDGCGSVTIRYSDVVSNTCGGSKVYLRTWTATDQCGNSANCLQTITVRDSTPPTLVCPADKVLECPATSGTNFTGVATAQDGCGAVTVTYIDSVSNTCGNAKIISRTWTATDGCGNSTNCTQTITIQDTTPPTIICPSNIVMECPAVPATNVTGVAMAQDGCGSVSIVFSDVVSNTCGGSSVIARTWTATDQCGNSAYCVQTITIRDTTRPILTTPTNIVVECGSSTDPSATGAATATDTCSAVTVTYSDSISNTCGATKIITRTWKAIDDCGNTTNRAQIITVKDTTPPTIVCPTNATLECPATPATNITGVATAQDGCGSVTIRYSDVISNTCGGAKVYFRTWTATDQCGNSANCLQTITVSDTTPPTLICPTNVVLECPAAPNTNVTGVATAQDGCGSVTVTYSDSISNTCGGAKIVARTWTATDGCGNSTNCVQTITIRDTTPPVINCPSNIVLECPALPTTNVTGIATAQDGCGSVTVIFSDVVSNTCGGSRVIARTWTATDQCGNSAQCLQTITIRDTTRPTLTTPTNIVVECGSSTAPSATGTATAQDTCSGVTVSYSDIVSNTCGLTKIITRTWTATDDCGNTTNRAQIITVRDTTPPTISCPPNATLECPATPATNITGVATAQDGCGSVTIRYSDVISNTCGGAKVYFRTWTATDQCGNSANCLQTITVSDTTPPTLICPTNVVLECPAAPSTNVTGVATAQDGCGSVTVTYSDSVSNTCGGAKIVARTWTAIDGCGNGTNCVQTITIRDTTPPVITCPSNIVLECPALPTTNVTGIATAQDGCGSVTVIFSDVVSNTCGGSRVIARTWTATDQCGNSAQCVQTITIRDTTRPTLTTPTNIVVECGSSTAPSATGTATAQDTCSGVTVSYSDIVSNTCGLTKIITRTWTATDDCGNTTNRAQIITVRDTTPPTISCPSNATLECPATAATNITGVATAQDGCGSVTIRYSDVISNTCGGAKVYFRTWTATDQCGNSANCMQTITVRDTTPPSLVCPTNVVLECPNTNTGTNFTGVATAQDGCGSVTVSYSDAVTNTCGAARIIARTWTATDGCGNSTNCVQTITVRDTTPPTIVCPSNLVLECPAITTTNATGMATAQDGCGSVVITYSDSVSNTCGGAKVIFRTWTATDACGNRANCLQTITVRDTTPPTITAPPDLTVECPGPTTTNATGVATAADGCGSVTISYSDSVTNGCGGARVISRTWSATDGCGNRASDLQIITVVDTTPPSLILPANVVLQCPGDTRTNVTGTARATTGCGSVTISYSDVVSNSCALTKTVWRLWTATDQCGLTTNGLQIITVVDTTKPSIGIANFSVQCAGNVPPALTNLAAFQAAGGSATDACSATLTFALMSDSGIVGSCPGTVTRVYRVTDACGNYGEATQLITVDDTIAPVLVCPTNTIVECGSSLNPTNMGGARATDNCSTNVTLAYSDAVVQGQYSLGFYVADPDTNSGPYSPTYLKFAPGSLPCPDSAVLTGRALDPLRNAVAFATNGQLDALTSIGNVSTALGQIMPYEVVIQASGGPGPERGTIDFTAAWATYTTSNNHFGYDTNYMVYCAFVDAADPGSIDPNNNARVESYSSIVINPGTIDEAIQGTFRVSGLDAGDRVVVEIWMVLDSTMPAHTGGTVNANLVSAQTVANPPVQITVGNQTDSLGNLSKIFPMPPPQQQPPLGPLPQQPPTLPGSTISVINRTWTATDNCGNQSSCVQQIMVRDTQPPVITAPDVVLECPATDTSTNVTGAAIVQDACGSTVKFYYTDTVTNGCGSTKIISRTWTATDDSGNTTNYVQTISVRDTTPPALTIPTNVVVECGSSTAPSATGSATAQDTCSAAVVSYSDVVSNTCGGAKIIARTWIATDDCGNSTNRTQIITVRDSTPPTIMCPSNLVLNCPALTTTNVTGVATAQDGCGSASVTYSDSVSNNCGGAMTISRTWTATDSCGNIASCVQTIAVLDSTPISIVCPTNVVLECPATPATNVTGVAAASAGCRNVVVAYSDSVSNTCGGAKVIRRTWTATDGCGNSANCMQTITIRDITPPTLLCQPNRTVQLGVGWSFDAPTATDTCSSVTVQVVNTITNLTATNAMIAIRTWLASDGCGNTNSCSQSITVMLGTPPVITSQPQSQTVLQNNDATLSVSASGTGPMLYQWQCNGTNLAGATNSTLLLKSVQFTSAGLYCAVVSSPGGTATSSAAVLDVTSRLLTQYGSSGETLTWASPFILQWATNMAGPYTDVPGATSPYFYNTVTNPPKFFRLRAPSFVLFANQVPGGQVRISGTGVSGCNFIIQASTNLTTWSNVSTNPSPVVCMDSNAWQYPRRFYRAVLAINPLPPPPALMVQPQSQTAGYGDTATLSVSAGGAGPFAYQWQLNGTNLSGATGSSLGLSGLQFTNAGLYSVVVSNAGGVVTSSVAVFDVAPKLLSQPGAGGLTLTWAGSFRLQSAANVGGPYTDIPGASSPYLYKATNGPRQFFRLRSQPFSLTLSNLPGGQFRIDGAGVPGANFVIQASSDLKTWTDLQTSPSPFKFVDANAWQHPRRFYRAVLAK